MRLVNLSAHLARSGTRAALLRPVLVTSARKATQAALDRKKLTVTYTSKPKEKLPKKQLVFGKTFTDHMLEVDWTQENGWTSPRIKPYENFSLDPSTMVFHYGLECFEGLKAYTDSNKAIRLYRPEMNMARLATSCERLSLPSCDGTALLDCIKELLKVDRDWIPDGRGYSLYLRPTVIGTQASLGVTFSTTAKLFVIACPVGPYYASGFNPVSLLANPNYTRAWPGGTGGHKCGGNYAPCVVPQVEAAKQGYTQLLWLMGEDHKVTEAGMMNFFMLWKNESGETELITAPLDGTILPGVTRDSILSLAREWDEFKVSERYFTMPEVVKAVEEHRVIEMFGAGTAAIVSPVKSIGYQGKDYDIPLKLGNSGELSKKLIDTIMAIQYGEISSPWSVLVD